MAVQLKRPRYLPGLPEHVTVNVVRACEVDPPAGVQPVEWVLATTGPIGVRAEVLSVLETYRCQWRIEEYFKALKSGCAFERRQLESFDALERALAIFLPIAWRLLLLRNMARTSPDVPANAVLTATQIDVLRSCSKSKFPASPTARDALFAVAALGGHIRSNGEPGWIVLGRGMEHLLTLEAGWTAALQAAGSCAQS